VTLDPHARSSPASVLQSSPASDGGQPEPRSVHSNGSGSNGPTVWMRRITVLIFVILCAVVGVLLVVLPWSLQWTANRFLWGYPDLRTALSNGFVRGLCSGLGVINLWIGFREAVHYREEPAPSK
jgi:hypothetical protein